MSRVSQKFKPGDRVRCINFSGYGRFFSSGKVYTVIRWLGSTFSDETTCIEIIGDEGTIMPYANRFELAEQDSHRELKRYLETQEGDISEIIKLFTDPTA